MTKIFTKTKLVLLVIILVASLLRVWRLNEVPVSLFSDELDVGYQAYSLLSTGRDYFGNAWPVSFQFYHENRADLYIYSLIPTIAIFGVTPWGVRLPTAVFGILGVWSLFLLVRQMTKDDKLALISAGVLAISPWHIQYSRLAFDATMLLTFLLFGLYFFFRSLTKPKYLWISVALLVFTPWIYQTAKLFTPILLIFVFLVWRKQITKFKKIELIRAAIIGLLLCVPIIYSTFFAGGILRAEYLSVFSDPTTKSEVDYSILYDTQVRNAYGGGILSKISSRVIHNKFTFWGSKVINNYISSLSFEFLFLKGDPNLRHSIGGIGQFYKFEVIPLILGILFFFTKFKDKKIRYLILFWVFAGILPAAITRDGGNHATRLILILPPLVFLISYGLVESFRRLKGLKSKILLASIVFLYLISFGFYEHNYWIHNIFYSERSWQVGYKEVITFLKDKEQEFTKMIITNANDDPRIFFASLYPASPQEWQKGLEKKSVSGFGELEHFGKYYFGQVDGSVGLANLSDYLDYETLYVASSREIKGNIITGQQSVPEGLTLLKAVQYPSGEPAFYIFAKK
jgi:4-amino-4-deoxy-L-arabinose transferase-like glycosyltransferase